MAEDQSPASRINMATRPSGLPVAMEIGVPKASSGAVNGLLARVLARQHISVVYQPIVDLVDGSIIGFEALARPTNLGDADGVGGFFASAQQLGVIRDLDWLCRRAAVAEAQRGLPDGVFLSINVSTELLMDNPMLDAAVIMELIGGSFIKPDRVVLEVVAPENGNFVAALQEYRKYKLKVAVAAVAPNHTQALEKGMIDYIKLSRDVAANLTTPEMQAFVRKAVEFGRSNEITVIAEGIEDDHMKTGFSQLGVRWGQGFHIGMPAPIENWASDEDDD